MSQVGMTNQQKTNRNPMDILDFTMTESNKEVPAQATIDPNKYFQKYTPFPTNEVLYHQLLNNSVKASNKYYLNQMERVSNHWPQITQTFSGHSFGSNHSTTNQHIKSEANYTINNVPSNTYPTNVQQVLPKVYSCPHCSFQTNRNNNLNNHLQTHFLERPNAHPSCGYCATLNNYRIDRMTNNANRQMNSCNRCAFLSPTIEEAIRHLKTHLDESMCICNGDKRTVVNHFQQVPQAHQFQNNQPKVPHPSPIIAVKEEKVDSEKKVVAKAEKSVNSNPPEPKIFSCPHCDYVANRPQNLRRHVITHTGERPHCCPICPYRAPDLSSLRVHTKTHTGERPHSCPECPYKAVQKSTLRNHLKTHTGEKPYACPHCEYKSASRTNLTSHVMIHSGMKPFTCPHCSYKATQRSSLKCHIRTHTGEKPFSCHKCEYKSAALGNLHSHLRTHNREAVRAKEKEEIEAAGGINDSYTESIEKSIRDVMSGEFVPTVTSPNFEENNVSICENEENNVSTSENDDADVLVIEESERLYEPPAVEHTAVEALPNESPVPEPPVSCPSIHSSHSSSPPNLEHVNSSASQSPCSSNPLDTPHLNNHSCSNSPMNRIEPLPCSGDDAGQMNNGELSINQSLLNSRLNIPNVSHLNQMVVQQHMNVPLNHSPRSSIIDYSSQNIAMSQNSPMVAHAQKPFMNQNMPIMAHNNHGMNPLSNMIAHSFPNNAHSSAMHHVQSTNLHISQNLYNVHNQH